MDFKWSWKDVFSPLKNIICSLIRAHPLSPSTLVNFLIHLSLRKVGESTFSFSFGVNISQWNYSFGPLNALESQRLIGKGVKWKSVNAVTKPWLSSAFFFFQTEHNFALQIFVLGRVWGCVFFLLLLVREQQTPHHKPLKMRTRHLLSAISGACVNRCLWCLVGYLWDCHREYLIRSGHNVYSKM